MIVQTDILGQTKKIKISTTNDSRACAFYNKNYWCITKLVKSILSDNLYKKHTRVKKYKL